MNLNNIINKRLRQQKASIITILLISSFSVIAEDVTPAMSLDKVGFESYINNHSLNEINQFDEFQEPHRNRANIYLNNASNTDITTYQKKIFPGKGNEVVIKSEGNNNVIKSTQIGAENASYISTNGNENLAVMHQFGINNNGAINQNGNNNEAGIIQSGYGNYDIIEQNGDGNKALIINTARNLRGGSGSQITQDNSSSPILLIDGMSRYNISVSSKQ